MSLIPRHQHVQLMRGPRAQVVVEDHPHYIYNGSRSEVIAHLCAGKDGGALRTPS